MAGRSNIEWTDASWNPIVGCSIVSPGCTNCYAMKMAGRIEAMQPSGHYAGTTQVVNGKTVWTGKMVLAPDHILTQPLRWRRGRRIFVNSMGDLFHEDVPDDWIARVFAVMALTPQHTYQVLTKRSARMRAYCSEVRETWCRSGPPISGSDRIHEAALSITGAEWMDATPGQWPLPNVWLGVSAEDQRRANERVPDLMATPAAVRFVSAEPLLGPINFEAAWHGENALDSECWGDCAWCTKGHPPLHNCYRGRQSGVEVERGRSGLDWVIAGGESGPGARPMHPEWARAIRDQCAAADVPFFFKQWGSWFPALDRDVEDPDWRAPYAGALNDSRPEIAWLNLKGGCGFHGERFHIMRRVGKRAAGRLLDGQEHNGMPSPREASR